MSDILKDLNSKINYEIKCEQAKAKSGIINELFQDYEETVIKDLNNKFSTRNIDDYLKGIKGLVNGEYDCISRKYEINYDVGEEDDEEWCGVRGCEYCDKGIPKELTQIKTYLFFNIVSEMIKTVYDSAFNAGKFVGRNLAGEK